MEHYTYNVIIYPPRGKGPPVRSCVDSDHEIVNSLLENTIREFASEVGSISTADSLQFVEKIMDKVAKKLKCKWRLMDYDVTLFL